MLDKSWTGVSQVLEKNRTGEILVPNVGQEKLIKTGQEKCTKNAGEIAGEIQENCRRKTGKIQEKLQENCRRNTGVLQENCRRNAGHKLEAGES